MPKIPYLEFLEARAAAEESQSRYRKAAPKKPPKDIRRFQGRGSLYGDLEFVTIVLALNHELHPAHKEVRAVVDSLIKNGLKRSTIGLFNRTFGKEMIHLRLLFKSVKGGPWIRADVSHGRIAFALWKFLLSDEPTRLKRCPECQQYYFDYTRPANRRRCNQRCTSKATSRAYRVRLK